MLGPGGADGRLRPLCAHADGRVGIAKLAIDGCGELARLLCGLGRPVRRHELERFPELRHELPQLVAAGLTLLAPLCGPEGLEGLIVVDERLDGQDFSRADIETLKALCEASAVPLHNAQRCHAQARGLLDALAALAPVDPCLDSARAAATDLLERAAMALPDRQRELVLKAAALGEWAASPSGRRALACLAGCQSYNPNLGAPSALASQINFVTPAAKRAGDPDFTLTVNGGGFVDGSIVQWNGSNRTTTFVDSTQLTAAISKTDIASPGTIPIRVLAPGVNVTVKTSHSPPWYGPSPGATPAIPS